MPRSRSPPRERKRSRSRERSPGRDRTDRDIKRKREERDRREDPRREDKDRTERRDRPEREEERRRPDREDDRRDRKVDPREDGRDKTKRKRSRSPDRRGRDDKDGKRELTVKKDPQANEEDLNGKLVGQGEPAPKKAEPLSLEELLRKKKEQQELEAKPKFLSKAEREALALAKREQQVAAQRAGTVAVVTAARSDQDARRRDDERKRAEDDRKKYQEEREREKELELIKQQYLGQEKVKKRVLRPSEKFRFNFDWEATDDTSRDLNPLYNNLHEASLLFGRGFRAGIDRREQKKTNATSERELVRQLREKAGIVETREMRAADTLAAERADKYDGFDMHTDKHWTEKPLEAMSERDWRIFREDFNISYKGTNTNVNPMRNWDEAEFPKPIKKAIERVGYKKPSPIQMASIPLGLQQRDVIGIAETGSGKTAAFVIPMLVYIMKQPPMTEENEADGPYSVVLAPTRELAQQIEEETLKLAHYTTYRVASVVGGVNIEEQGSKLRRGCEIVIATPGRMLDCLQRHYCVLNQCNYVVMDEADRMIDLGFESQVTGVLDAMPSSNLKPENDEEPLEENKVYRTTYMFSATMPAQVERIAKKYMRRPVVVTIGTAGDVTANVTQRVLMLKDNEKPGRLSHELDAVEEKRAIVFVNTKRQCDNVYKILEEHGYACTILHSGKTQQQREAGIKGFRDLTFNILIATDVAGRGIDIPDVALVINYDMPNNIEMYTHRIGRTGRAGKKGIAVTFLTGHDTEVYFDLKKKLEESKSPVPAELARHEASRMKQGHDGKKKRDETIFLN